MREETEEIELVLGLKGFHINKDIIRNILMGEHIIYLLKADREATWKEVKIRIKNIEIVPAELGSFLLIQKRLNVKNIETVLIVDIGYRGINLLLVDITKEKYYTIIHRPLDVKSVYEILEML